MLSGGPPTGLGNLGALRPERDADQLGEPARTAGLTHTLVTG